MTKPRRLGRGLEALLGRTPERVEPPIQVKSARPGAVLSPGQPRGAYGDEAGEPYGAGAIAYEPTSGGPAPDDSAAEAAGLPLPESAHATLPAEPGGAPAANDSQRTGPMRVDIAQIDRNPRQPRQDFDEDETRSLSASLADHGLLQPVVVRRAGGRFELIAGERRLRAAEMAGWTDVPAQVVEADDRQVAELAIIENLQRKDLNPLEKAASFQRYLQTYGATQEELAGRLNLDRSTIANLIRLLELPEEVRSAVRRGAISQGHARALLPLGDEREQVEFARRVTDEGLSVRQTEALVQETIQQADHPPLGVIGADGRSSGLPRRPPSEHLAALEQEFRLALGTKVKITHSSRGRGKLVIHFSSHEEFERIRRQICDPGLPEGHSEAG